MSEITPKGVKAGQALYGKSFLYFYDRIALGWGLRFAWKCPARYILELYSRYVSGNHLDIGVGTGYFMDRCMFPVEKPRLALLDLNSNCLEVTGKKLARYNPEKYLRNVLEPITIDCDRFDSIGLVNILHCLPGTMKTKAVVFENVKPLMNPGAVIFGSTILGRGVKHTLVAESLNLFINKTGYITNREDNPEDLARGLARCFSYSEIKVMGSIALFWAYN